MSKATVIGRISKRDMKIRQYKKKVVRKTNLQLLREPFHTPFSTALKGVRV